MSAVNKQEIRKYQPNFLVKNNVDFYMCSPEFFDIKYTINPWMKINSQLNKRLAIIQWNQLFATLQKIGAQVEVIRAINHPDLVYVADSGLIYKNNFIVSNFKHQERKVENPFWKSFFEEKYKIITLSSQNTFEGGDGLINGKNFFSGYGFRTSKDAIYEIGDKLQLCSFPLELVDPKYYHLDTCFSILGINEALFYPNALSKSAVKIIEDHYNCQAIPEQDAENFACNLIVHENKIVLPENCPSTKKILEKFGFEVYCVNISEYIKAGGAVKCLTLRGKPLLD